MTEPRAPDGDERASDQGTGRQATPIVGSLKPALAFGVIAATIQMAVILSLMYC